MPHSNDTSLNILCSYAYIGRDKAFADCFYNLHKEGVINGMIDSGAFTKHNSKTTGKHVTLDAYCEWLQHYGNECEKYVMLDVITSTEESRRNYEQMVKRGLQPMFVFTMRDNNWEYLRQTMQVNQHCCVAGGVATKGSWLKQRFQRVYAETDGKALTHGLGYVVYPTMYQLPLASVDSSSWNNAQQWGVIHWYDGKGLHSIGRKELAQKKGEVDFEFLSLLHQLRVTPQQLRKEEAWRGQRSIIVLCSAIAYIKYQRYSQRQGLRLFLSVSNKKQLDTILLVSRNLNTITYNEFRNAL